MKKIAGNIATVILILVIAGFAFVYFSPDYNAYIVESESMKPAIHMGDMVITGPSDNPFGKNISPGNIITYNRNGQLVTHRLLEINGEELVTKGDAVEDPDPWQVTVSDVQGVYLFRLPSLGYASTFIRTRTGWLVAVLAPAAVAVGFIFREIRKEMARRKNEAL